MKNNLLVPVLLAATLLPTRSQVFTNADAYALPTWHSPYTVEPILSVGDTVTRTSNFTQQYQFTGIPDGIGVHPINQSTAAVFVNHEFNASRMTRPIIGEPRVRGSYVSRLVLDRQRRGVLKGDLAFTEIYVENTFSSNLAREGDTSPALSRLCSGSVAGPREGMDRYIYLAGEESEGDTYDVRGGSAVAVVDGKAHILPGMGHMAWENLLVQPRVDTGLYANKTVIMLMEDGPASAPYCGLFMYVGTKNRTSTNPLARNGLIGGQFYVLRSLDEDYNYEFDFNGEGSAVSCEWVRIPNIAQKTYIELKDAAIAQDFFRFSRPEDGAWSKTNKSEYFFVTTGGDGVVGDGTGNNKLGRFYRITLDPTNPLGYANLEIITDADRSIHGDVPVSPDNMDTSARYAFLQEDGTSQSRPVMAQRNRDGSIWRYDMWDLAAPPVRIAQQTSIGRDGIYAVAGSVTTPGALPATPAFTTNRFTPTARGIWETSGIHATDSEFGDGTLIFDVQAHGPTTAPGDNTGEDGQLMILIPNP